MSEKIYANSSKRLPIVFCLDVSPSMSLKVADCMYSSIELLNKAIGNFLKELKNDTKVRTSAEIALVTFSTNIEIDTSFESVGSIEIQDLVTVEEGGTNTAKAIIRSIEKIEQRKQFLDSKEIGYYVPFFVLVTDGNPDKNDNADLLERAITLVQQHCDSHIGASEIIIPFIVGVGDDVEISILNRLSERFTGTAIILDSSVGEQDKLFEEVFKFIGNSVTGSIHLNDSPEKIIEPIKTSAAELAKKIKEGRERRKLSRQGGV